MQYIFDDKHKIWYDRFSNIKIILLTEGVNMKKFFGVTLIIAGALWSLIFTITGFNGWSDFSGASIFSTIILIAIGLFVLWIGKKLLGNKKKNKEEHQKGQNIPKTQIRNESPVKTPTPLKEVRQLVEEKIGDVQSSTFPISNERLKESLFSLNGEKIPFEFKEANDKNANLIAVWKMADAKYLDMLGIQKNKLQEEFSVLLKFDEEKGELRCKDRMKRKSSSFGFGGAGMEFSSFSGKAVSAKKEIVIGRKADGKIGKVVDISLDTTILQNAIKQVAEKSGWKIKRIVGKL